jgi:hypothetical protein
VVETREELPVDRLWAMATGELLGAFDEAIDAINRQTAVVLRTLCEIQSRAVPGRAGAASAAAWVRNRHRVSTTTAYRLVRAAVALDAAPEVLQRAVDAGEVNLDQAEVITRAVENLPRHLGVKVRGQAAEEMVRLSAELEPRLLHGAGERILQLVAPEVADEMERLALERVEARAYRDRYLTIARDRGGVGYRVSGRLTNEAAAFVRAAVEPLCAPATSSRCAPDEIVGESEPETAAGPEATVGPIAEAAAQAPVTNAPVTKAPADKRTAGQRRADALVEVCRLALNTTELPRNGGDRPQVAVNIDYDILQQELGAGTIDNGERVTPETARRMACDCRLLPIVFAGESQPLDVGRTRRLVGSGLRHALIARDRGCAFPGCDRGPRWTDAHHVVPWASGGPTSLANTVLLCAYHHTTIHRPNGWAVHMDPDGLPSFVPPPHLDPARTPQRNRYHRRL